MFCFYIWVLGCTRAISTYFLIEFSFVILECPVLFVLFNPFSLSFNSSSFRQYLLIYPFKLHCKVCLVFRFGLFSPTYPFVSFFFLSTFSCHNFFPCLSSLISYQGFVFRFAFLTGTLILAPTNFARHLKLAQ